MKLNNVVLMGLMVAGSLISASGAYAAQLDTAQKQQVEGVVHDYLVKNPQVMMDSLMTYQAKQQAEQMDKAIKKVELASRQNAEAIFNDASDPVVGNPKGKVTLVEFFDYQCSHCIAMHPTIDALMKKYPDLRVVYKEFPIRGPVSEEASRVALAAGLQGKYQALHSALMDAAGKGQLTEEGIYKIAASVGLNVDKLKADAKSPAIDKQIKADYQLAQTLGLWGTPALFVAKSTVKNNAAVGPVFVPGEEDEATLGQRLVKLGA